MSVKVWNLGLGLARMSGEERNGKASSTRVQAHKVISKMRCGPVCSLVEQVLCIEK